MKEDQIIPQKILKDVQMFFVLGQNKLNLQESSQTTFHIKMIVDLCGCSTQKLSCQQICQLCRDFQNFIRKELTEGGACRLNGLLVS